MAEVKNETPKVEKVVRKPRKKVVKKVIVGVDSSAEDVLKCASEGHTLFFEDGDNFLELPEEVLKELSSDTRQRYRVAKAITNGDDVIGAATDGILGYKTDYNVRPGSAGENTAVYGKDPKMEYYWGRNDKHNQHLSEGWQVDEDPNVKTRFNESGTIKTLGGQNKPEGHLYSRPKEVGQALRAKRKELRDSRLKKTQNTARESAAKAGVRITG